MFFVSLVFVASILNAQAQYFCDDPKGCTFNCPNKNFKCKNAILECGSNSGNCTLNCNSPKECGKNLMLISLTKHDTNVNCQEASCEGITVHCGDITRNILSFVQHGGSFSNWQTIKATKKPGKYKTCNLNCAYRSCATSIMSCEGAFSHRCAVQAMKMAGKKELGSYFHEGQYVCDLSAPGSECLLDCNNYNNNRPCNKAQYGCYQQSKGKCVCEGNACLLVNQVANGFTKRAASANLVVTQPITFKPNTKQKANVAKIPEHSTARMEPKDLPIFGDTVPADALLIETDQMNVYDAKVKQAHIYCSKKITQCKIMCLTKGSCSHNTIIVPKHVEQFELECYDQGCVGTRVSTRATKNKMMCSGESACAGAHLRCGDEVFRQGEPNPVTKEYQTCEMTCKEGGCGRKVSRHGRLLLSGTKYSCNGDVTVCSLNANSATPNANQLDLNRYPGSFAGGFFNCNLKSRDPFAASCAIECSGLAQEYFCFQATYRCSGPVSVCTCSPDSVECPAVTNKWPTPRPTMRPTTTPKPTLTNAPTPLPTKRPSANPTTSTPSNSPTTARPTTYPTLKPTRVPTMNPVVRTTTKEPTTRKPTKPRPTERPTTAKPTTAPTRRPTKMPTLAPTWQQHGCYSVHQMVVPPGRPVVYERLVTSTLTRRYLAFKIMSRSKSTPHLRLSPKMIDLNGGHFTFNGWEFVFYYNTRNIVAIYLKRRDNSDHGFTRYVAHARRNDTNREDYDYYWVQWDTSADLTFGFGRVVGRDEKMRTKWNQRWLGVSQVRDVAITPFSGEIEVQLETSEQTKAQRKDVQVYCPLKQPLCFDEHLMQGPKNQTVPVFERVRTSTVQEGYLQFYLQTDRTTFMRMAATGKQYKASSFDGYEFVFADQMNFVRLRRVRFNNIPRVVELWSARVKPIMNLKKPAVSFWIRWNRFKNIEFGESKNLGENRMMKIPYDTLNFGSSPITNVVVAAFRSDVNLVFLTSSNSRATWCNVKR